MKPKKILLFYLSVMAALILYALLFPSHFVTIALKLSDYYLGLKFVHVLCVSLFFANVVLGTIWEARSVLFGRAEIIRYTYDTVAFLDAVFSAPLIILSVLSGIALGTVLGGVWSVGWISLAFLLFMFSGIFWIVADIPTQYKIYALFKSVKLGAQTLPKVLTRLLWLRMAINLLSIIPLVGIFYLMIHKPEVPKISAWFKSRAEIQERVPANTTILAPR